MAYTYNDFLKKATDNGTLSSFTPQELSLAKAYPEYGISAASLKQEQSTATTSAQRALADEAAAQLAASYKTTSYNGFTGSKQDEIDKILGQIGSFPDFSWDQEAPTYTNPYEQLQQDLLDKILNREDFTWSKDTDPVFGEYQKQYLREGERATANALAQAAAAAGGQTSSYAATAAAQAGNYYASQLSDKIPELYNQAYQRYLSEYEMMADDLGLVNAQQQLDYQEYLDQLGQYNTDKEFAYQEYLDDYNKLLSYLDAVNGQEQMDYQEYLDKLGQYNGDKEFAYQQYLDNYNKLQEYLGNLQDINADEYQKYLDQIEQEQYQQEWERDQQRYEQEQKQLAQKMAQAQVDGILQAGVMPSSSLIAASGYSQEYINAMLQYYRQKAAAATYSSSGGSGSSSSSPSSSSSTTSGKFISTSNLVSIPQYGEVSVADAQRLKEAGLVRLTGYDRNGKPIYVPTANKNTQNIQLSR